GAHILAPQHLGATTRQSSGNPALRRPVKQVLPILRRPGDDLRRSATRAARPAAPFGAAAASVNGGMLKNGVAPRIGNSSRRVGCRQRRRQCRTPPRCQRDSRKGRFGGATRFLTISKERVVMQAGARLYKSI